MFRCSSNRILFASFPLLRRNFGSSPIRSNPLHALITGPPAAGKGTISERIIKDFKIVHIASGDLLRNEITKKSAIGMEAQVYMKQGKLVPDDIVVKLVADQLKLLEAENWLLDGFPRTVEQAKKLDKMFPIKYCLNLDVPHEVVIKRVSSRWTHLASGRVYNTFYSPPKVMGIDDETGDKLIQREDDKEETVKKRLEQYDERTKPMLAYYQQQNKLTSFSGTTSDEIFPKFAEYLKSVIFSKR